jgi:thiamine-monophosphate kinase
MTGDCRRARAASSEPPGPADTGGWHADGVNEDDLIRTIRRLVAADAPGLKQGIGDDAAVMRIGDRDVLLTTDMLVEGVDFDRAITSARDIGYRAMAANLSDIAAMAGSPRFGLVALGMPVATEARFVVELFGGMREASDEHAAVIVGGDLSAADNLVISVSLMGEAPLGGAVLRSGARTGDRIVVTGRLGAAAGGLRLLQRGPRAVANARRAGWGDGLVQAFLRPSARVGEGQILARSGATAMIDVSDGLTRDLVRLCDASGVGAVIWLDAMPVAEALHALAPALEADPLQVALGGGEDFELLAALPAGRVEVAAAALAERFATPLTEVGEFRSEPGLFSEASRGAGDLAPVEPAGWDHFAR